MKKPELHATIWQEFPHFQQFQNDPRLSGIRLNSAMAEAPELGEAVAVLSDQLTVPWYVDLKGIQPRVVKAAVENDRLVIWLNHPIEVDTPVGVAFKAEKDFGRLARLEEGGIKLIFDKNPAFKVGRGESLHIIDESFKIKPKGSIFSDQEKEKIAAVVPYCKRYYLSYVESQSHLDELFEIVGRDSFIWAKIETREGLRFISDEFKRQDNIGLVGARGDLYIEVFSPHEILAAMKLIASKDPNAMAASRIFLSIIGYKNPLVTYLLGKVKKLEEKLGIPNESDEIVERYIGPNTTPECHDFEELAWLYDLGFRNFLLCDEICLEGEMLDIALEAFKAFAEYYPGIAKQEILIPRQSTYEFLKERAMEFLGKRVLGY